MLSCVCLDDLQPSDSDDERRNTPAAQASRAEMAEILNNSVRREAERLASTHRVQANVDVLNRIDRSPPPYVTPPSSSLVQSDVTVHPNAPRVLLMRNIEAESERATFRPDLTGQTFGRVEYTRVPTSDRFAFTPVPVNPLPVPEPRPLQTITRRAYQERM